MSPAGFGVFLSVVTNGMVAYHIGRPTHGRSKCFAKSAELSLGCVQRVFPNDEGSSGKRTPPGFDPAPPFFALRDPTKIWHLLGIYGDESYVTIYFKSGHLRCIARYVNLSTV